MLRRNLIEKGIQDKVEHVVTVYMIDLGKSNFSLLAIPKNLACHLVIKICVNMCLYFTFPFFRLTITDPLWSAFIKKVAEKS